MMANGVYEGHTANRGTSPSPSRKRRTKFMTVFAFGQCEGPSPFLGIILTVSLYL